MIDHLPSSAVERLQNTLSKKRFQHSVGVAETAFLLADSWKNYPVDSTLLAWASLFHDCAKESRKERWTGEKPVLYGNELLDIPKLFHAPMSAWTLQYEYGIVDPSALMAVSYHPTGHPDFTPIGWMVYISDFLEPGRVYFEQREEFLEQACADPLTGLRLVTGLRLEAVRKKGKPIHPIAQRFKKFLDSKNSL